MRKIFCRILWRPSESENTSVAPFEERE